MNIDCKSRFYTVYFPQVDANVMVVMDSFALPVEGTETRVNAQAQGYEYMTAYIEAAKQVGRLENAIGWYHSHPGTTGHFWLRQEP